MHEITRRHLLKLGLAGGALLASGIPARALVNVVVTGGNFVPLPIAIPDFASSDPSFGQQVADIVRANLTRSGLFAPLPADQMQGIIGDVNNPPDFADWRGKNVDALVMGSVTSYARARAESLGMQAKGGIAERADRLVAVLVVAFFADVFNAIILLDIVLWLLAAASTVTVVQRMVLVRRQALGLSQPAHPPTA